MNASEWKWDNEKDWPREQPTTVAQGEIDKMRVAVLSFVFGFAAANEGRAPRLLDEHDDWVSWSEQWDLNLYWSLLREHNNHGIFRCRVDLVSVIDGRTVTDFTYTLGSVTVRV